VKTYLADIFRWAKSKLAQIQFWPSILIRRTVMTEELQGSTTTADYLICRSTDVDDYSVWRLDFQCDQLLHRVGAGAGAKLDCKHQLISIGNYLLEWGPITLQDYTDSGIFPYRLLEFDPSKQDPLGVHTAKVVRKGAWPKAKFWKSRPDFGNPEGAAKAYDKGEKLILLPLGSFVLNIIPTTGRGTFRLFSFDPCSADPLYEFPTWTYGSFLKIQFGHELIPLGNYVLDRVTETGKFCLWSFDPMKSSPLLALREGSWKDIDAMHRLIPIGEYVLDWDMGKAKYRLWKFDPKSADPLSEELRSGPVPQEFGMTTTLTGHQMLRPIDEACENVPGTIDFMRRKIKHVVYYMIENRSFDHVCGWLYEKGEQGINFVGSDKGPFKGAKADMFNIDPDATGNSNKVYLQKYKEGKSILPSDPYHDLTDTLRQLFYENRNGYAERKKPDMGGFVWNNGVPDVMFTFTPKQLPVLNGLARAFAISDMWFCSMPGATDANRAFALTGSALGQLNNFMNGPQYTNWADAPLRGSIWKVLWANGFSDWKIYNSITWAGGTSTLFPLTYHLFLAGQIPTVDAKLGNHIAGIDQFMTDAQKGQLPAFSFVEPIWIASDKPATSYHPYGGGGTAPGEKALNELYEALKNGPAWNETLLIITFDEHGGLYDHVAPPYAENPWPCDEVDGFRYDIMGVRVPTILVSPWIKERTVFRSPTSNAYDSTSILATLLHWHGIPKARWCLGARTHNAPTFENVFLRESARTDKPPFSPPDKALAPESESQKLGDLHELMVPRLVHSILAGKRTDRESNEIANEILSRAADAKTLNMLMTDFAKRMR
jgi:phospholipase C